MTYNNFHVKPTNCLPLGSDITSDGVRFSAVCKSDDCGILLFPESGTKPVKIPFTGRSRLGRIYAMEITNLKAPCKYLIYDGDNCYPDPYMKAVYGYGMFGESVSPISVLSEDSFAHKAPKPNISFENSMFYMLHIRGYSAHNSSKIKEKGTFKGLAKKLDYISGLGFTSLILMPVYEFNEIIQTATNKVPEHIKNLGKFVNTTEIKNKVNFWGYTDGYYYIPKSSYAYTNDSVNEFHELVEKCHEKGLEVILQFKFPDRFGAREITDILRFWANKYNIDGFQLIGSNNYAFEIANDPALDDIKLICDDSCTLMGAANTNTGYINNSFIPDMRSFLKGDPNKANDALKNLRDVNPNRPLINAIARQDTMRLYDIVSYNEKHNEDNGENGRDGSDYNYSWNCGIEGATRKKIITDLRNKQIKNGLVFTFLSQGAPLIYSGDEFGNTQFGNNNPYNQDNPTGYIKWSSSTQSNQIINTVKRLIDIKKSHPALRSNHLLTGRDSLSYGYPDISLHSNELWRPNLSPTSHSFGILYFDKYFDSNDNRLLYFAINMHWEEYRIALPNSDKGYDWKILLSTDDNNSITKKEVVLSPRSIMILETDINNEL